jgi:hypothetical protein
MVINFIIPKFFNYKIIFPIIIFLSFESISKAQEINRMAVNLFLTPLV